MSDFSGAIYPGSVVPPHVISTHMRAGRGGKDSWERPGVLLTWRQHVSPGYAQRGHCTIVGHVRLDNRSDLIDEFFERGEATPNDCQIVLRAYLALGSACCERLFGEFAFAIWDEKLLSLFCARDPLGVRPFYYRTSERSFEFSCTARELGARPFAPLLPEFESAFLTGFNEATEHIGNGDVLRLQPGTHLTYANGIARCERYWSLHYMPMPGSPQQGYRERFLRSVQVRTSDDPALGIMLSGGLDSSSIAVAYDHLSANSSARTYSIVFPASPDVDERSYIDAVLDKGKFTPSYLPGDGMSPLDDVGLFFDALSVPPSGPGIARDVLICRSAADLGTTVLLDGHCGDEVNGHGTDRLLELAAGHDWIRLLTLMTSNADSARSLVQGYSTLLRRHSPAHSVGRALGRMGMAVTGADRAAGPRPEDKYLRSDYLANNDVKERVASERRLGQAVQQPIHYGAVASANVGRSLEILDAISRSHGLEVRYPFLDASLVSFCYSAPASAKMRMRETRSLGRRALSDLLPRKVATRRSKTNFLPELRKGLASGHPAFLTEVAADRQGILTDIVDRRSLQEGIASFLTQPDKTSPREVMFLWRLAVLYLWRAGRQSP